MAEADPLVWIADALWFVTHRERDGKPLLHARTVGLVLAGGLLGELVLLGRVRLHEGLVVPVNTGHRLSESLAASVYAAIIAERHRLPARTWLSYLGAQADTAVGERLVRRRRVHDVRGRRGQHYVPVDINDASWQNARPRQLLIRREPLTSPDAVLLGLIQAGGLLPNLLYGGRAACTAYLNRALANLPTPLAGLIGQTEAAIGAAALTPSG